MAKTATKIRFEAKLERPAGDGDWMFLRLPQEASDQISNRGMTSVEGTFGGHAFQANLRPDGQGGHWLQVEPDLSGKAGAKAGDTVELEISQMVVSLEPEVPEDLRAALDSHAACLATWNATTPAARQDWVNWLTGGKKAETRAIRLNKMIDMLGKGKRRVCCYDRSGIYSGEFSCPDAAD